MGRLEDRLLNHPLHEQLAALRAALAEVSGETVEAADEHSEGTLDRIPRVLTYIEGVVAAADPALTTAAALEAVSSALTNATNAVGQLEASPATSTTLETYVEGALAAVAPLVTSTPLLAKRAGAAGKAFDTALSDSVKEVAERAQGLDEELEALEARRQEQATELATQTEQRQTQLTTAMDALTARVDTETQRLDTLVPEFESQFSTEQDTRKQEFETLRAEVKAQVDERIAELNTAAEETAAELDKNSEEVLGRVRGRLEDVERLYGVIADTTTTGAFRDEAKTQKEAADKWRVGAVAFGIAAAVLAVGSIVLAALEPDTASSAGAIVGKVTATLVAAGIAAYAGRQTGRHREREEEAKQLELELVAFPAFIESLEEDQQREVRRAFAERAFQGRPAPDAPRRALFRKEDSFGVAAPELVAALIAAVRQAERSGGTQP
jgi:hypothetical protein